MSKKIIIIGGNAAGPAAAAKARRTDPDAEITLIEQGKHISTGTCELPYVLSNEVPDPMKLVFFDDKSFEENKGAEVLLHHRVEKIHRKEKKVAVRSLKDKKEMELAYDSLILCTGSRARALPVFPMDAKNVFRLKTVANVQEIVAWERDHTVENVVVIGSGYIGLEAAENFRKAGKVVILLEKMPRLLPAGEEEISKLVEQTAEKEGIRFFTGSGEIEPYLEGDVVKSIKVNGERFKTDLVLEAAGFVPVNDIAVAAGLETAESDALKVNKKLQTNDSAIYAAGDNIEMVDLITRRPVYIPLATFARQAAYVAGENAAGGNAFLEPVVNNIGMRFFDSFVTMAGLSSAQCEQYKLKASSVHATAHNMVGLMPEARKVFGKVLFDPDSRYVLGASFYGGRETAGYADIISMMIRHRIPVDALQEQSYNYNPPLSPFVHLLSILGKQAASGK